MRTKHLLFTAAIVSAFAACTNDDFVSENGKTLRDDKGLLVELNPNFALAASKGVDAETRAYDQNANFVWVPEEINTADGSAIKPATIGLCWTGVNNANPEYSALQATDYRVFTNYKFEHRGWLFAGETMPDYDQCKATPVIKNGEFVPGYGDPEATWNTTKGTVKDTELETADGKYSKNTSGIDSKWSNTELSFGTGFFKSELGTIYQGEYIVYFPYTDEFFNGPVQASAPKEVELTGLKVAAKASNQVQHDLNTWTAMSKYAFSVGYKANMDGGVNAEAFTTKLLSGGVVVRLTNSANSTLSSGVKTVTLYSKDKQFILKQNLSAAAIKAAGNVGSKYGKNFYNGEATATSKTVVAQVSTTNGAALNPAKSQYVDIVIPVLPTSITDLKVLLTNENNMTAEVNIAGTTEIKSVGQGWTTLSDIDLSKLNFNQVYAMDEASFRAATNNEGSSCATDLVKNASKTVRVLGEIELSADAPAIAIRGGYTIVGEAGDALIINGGDATNISNQSELTNPRFIVNATDNFNPQTMNEPVLNCNVTVKSAGCCKAFGGRLVIGQATVGANATITVEGNDDAISTLAAKKANGIESTKDGWVSFDVEGKISTVNGTIINEGEITFGRVDRREPANDVKVQTLLNGKIQNKKTMTIFYAGEQTTSNDDAKLAVSNTGTLQNENGAEFTIEGELFFDGNGYNKGIINDRVSSQVTGNIAAFKCDPTLENNEYICDVNDPGKRFTDALTSVYKPTTIVRFVEESGKTYNFSNFVGKETGAYKTIKKYIVAVEDKDDPTQVTTTYFLGNNITLPALDIEGNNTLKFKSTSKTTYDSYGNPSTAAVWTNLTVSGDLLVAANGTLDAEHTSTNEYVGISKLAANNLTVNGVAYLANATANVTKTFALNNTSVASTITGTKVTVGTTAANGGLLNIQGLVTLNNNTDILVYGDIVAGSKAVATIVEATGSATNMPATVTYSGTNTYSNILTNWPKGGPSKML